MSKTKSMKARRAKFLKDVAEKWDKCAQDGTHILVAVTEVYPVTKVMDTRATTHLDSTTNRSALFACIVLLMGVGRSTSGSVLDDFCKQVATSILAVLREAEELGASKNN